MQDLWKLIQDNWVTIGVVYLIISKALTSVRDAVDKTPATDDNWFERLCTIVGKVGGYLFAGKRPNA